MRSLPAAITADSIARRHPTNELINPPPPIEFQRFPVKATSVPAVHVRSLLQVIRNSKKPRWDCG
jgi:hypothetical protein